LTDSAVSGDLSAKNLELFAQGVEALEFEEAERQLIIDKLLRDDASERIQFAHSLKAALLVCLDLKKTNGSGWRGTDNEASCRIKKIRLRSGDQKQEY
jgi:hypothetical protein